MSAGSVGVFFQNPVKGDIFAMVAELAIRHIEHVAILYLRPVCAVREKNKLRIRVDKLSDQPWASHAIHFDSFAGDPFHNPKILLYI